MIVELGLPVILVAILFIAPKLRPFCYSVLGAVIPLLFAYFSAVIAIWGVADSAERFAVDSMWTMSFVGYLVSLAIGMSLGFLKRPKNTASRILAASVASICVLSIVIMTS